MPGNHDEHTSIVFYENLRLRYENNPRVKAVVCEHPRVHQKYRQNAMFFQHGKNPGLAKTIRNPHMYFMEEAQSQGVKWNNVKAKYIFVGDLHHDRTEDVHGVEVIVMPSISGTDTWHRENGFIGSRQQSAAYLMRANGSGYDKLTCAV